MEMHRNLVIVGFGMAAHRLCERLTSHPDFAASGLRVLVLSEENRLAYDRVHLSEAFQENRRLEFENDDWYRERGITLYLGTTVSRINRGGRAVECKGGLTIPYEILVLATGSAPFVPAIPGTDQKGVFVYRTIDDLAAIADYAKSCKRASVMGGGLLGLEAARALKNLDLETSVVEFAPRLMPRQLDEGGARLLRKMIEGMDIAIHTDRAICAVEGESKVERIRFADGRSLATDMLVISAGIRPRQELAKDASLELGSQGGILVDGSCRTSDPHIYAVGECAAIHNKTYGLVSPCYRMVDVFVDGLFGKISEFDPGDGSTRLKLMGVEVASLGDPFASGPDVASVEVQHEGEGIYKKLVYSRSSKKILGAVLVGDATVFGKVLQGIQSGLKMDFPAENMLIPGAPTSSPSAQAQGALVCSCENVGSAKIRAAIDGGCKDVKALKACTKAGAGCGSCVPILQEMLDLSAATQKRPVCEHIPMTRPELYQFMKSGRIKNFKALMIKIGSQGAHGCEICKPTVASILASLWNEHILDSQHAVLQDTNDRYLANIQVNGTYSVVPRIPAGEITPEKLMVIARVARKYDLYTKITGGQRIDLFGARLEQLPLIWNELVEAGFESGHAYGKSVRTVKSCVGSTWCRYGVQDSVDMAILIENRYKGIRAPHKIKMAVSGCARECAEAQSKDVGVIASEKGWNLYVGGNGGMRPAHAQLFATDLSDRDLIRYIDRFLMYYIRSADRMTRTASWLRRLPGGLQHLKDVLIDDSFGLCAELEADMQELAETFQCEWKTTLMNPEKLKDFRPFLNSETADDSIRFVKERGQIRPLLELRS